jgi:hypothetical protein
MRNHPIISFLSEKERNRNIPATGFRHGGGEKIGNYGRKEIYSYNEAGRDEDATHHFH